MARETVYLMMLTLALLLTGLYVFIIATASLQARRAKLRQSYLQAIKPALETVLNAPAKGADARVDAYLQQVKTQMKKSACRAVLEEILLEYLEQPKPKPNQQRALTIALALELPQHCLKQVKSRQAREVAQGCRKAGLYQYRQALPDMQKALFTVSGETQFQLLMGISRMGEVSALCQAFETISQNVIVNERAAFEILAAFSGDKLELYSRMFHCRTEYVAMLFLKSADQAIAKALAGDISAVLHSGTKEMRIAAIRAMAKLEQDAPVEILVQALADADWEVRALAAKTLGMLTDPAVAAALSLALCDTEWWVRQHAAASLLADPDHVQLFLAAAETGDTYALDSILHVLEHADKQDLISKLLAAVPTPQDDETKSNKQTGEYAPLTA